MAARIIGALALLAAMICPLGARADLRTSAATKAPNPELKLPTGGTVRLAAYVGKKPVLIVFWASWCTNCQQEIPLLRKLNAGNFTVVAVNEGESAWKTRRFVAARNVDYPVVLDPDGSVAQAFGVPGIPACAIVSKSGTVVYRGGELPARFETYVEK